MNEQTRPSTIKDIKLLTKLSLSTISKYLNGGHVLPKNKALLDEAIKQLDFKVNQFARSLKTNRSNTIGILIPELNSTFHTSIIAHAEDVLRKNGYGMIICDSRLDKQTEIEAVEFLLSKKVDGLIIIPYDNTGKQLEALKGKAFPLVIIDRLIGTEFNSVVLNNRFASHLAMDDFFKKGHRDIAIIYASDSIYTMKERLLGYQEFLKKQHIPLQEEWMIMTEMTIQGGYEGFFRLMKAKKRPTALYLVNYEITLGAIIAINECGIKIGNELSIIGFDNLELTKIIHPKLTTVVQPIEKIAKEAANLLLSRLESPLDKSETIYVNAKLEKGDSVGLII